jgi:hypothetical protein
MNLQPGAHLPGGPLRSWQLAAVFLPFLLPLLYPLRFLTFMGAAPLRIGAWLFAALGLLLLGMLVTVWISGLVRDFPLWSLPALGTLLFFVSAFLQLFAQLAVLSLVIYPLIGTWGWPDGLSLAGNIWLMLLAQLVFLVIMMAVVIGLLRIVPNFQARVRQEWTLLSFLLYSIAILPVLGNDEFHGVEGYQIISLLVLAFGALLYLLVPRRWQRVLALVVPAILSPALMSLGLYQAFPAQSWANPTDLSFRLWEALQPVLYLSPLPILLLLASLAPRLPGNGKGQRSSPSAPNTSIQEFE